MLSGGLTSRRVRVAAGESFQDAPSNQAMKRTLKGAGSISAVPSGFNLFGPGELGGRPSTPLIANPLAGALTELFQSSS